LVKDKLSPKVKHFKNEDYYQTSFFYPTTISFSCQLSGFFRLIALSMSTLSEPTGIKSWAEDDRPREKLLLKGRSALSDAELIAILLGSGTRELSAVDLAKHILSSTNHSLNQLARLQVNDLKKFKGIGEAKAISIVASLELGRRRREEDAAEKSRIGSSRDIYELLSANLTDIDHEEFWIILLNRSNRVKDKLCISRGGISGTVVDARLIFKPALEQLASGVVLCHNHPSGNLQPSESDRRLTARLVECGRIFDIAVVDHVIFADHGYFSFADQSLL
jgi:DNA repair protein RadC